jgi:hypothetical protein
VSLPGRTGLHRASALAVTALCLVALLSLGGCNIPDLGSGDVDSDPTATPPTPRPSETPWGGAPHKLPAGWTAYYAPHFSIALPPGWRVEAEWNAKDPNPVYWSMRYVLYPPADPGTPLDPRVSVDEWVSLRGSQVRDYFCRPTANQEVRTVAGLPMRYSQGLGPTGRGRDSITERDWTFISNQKTVYGLVANDEVGNDIPRRTENLAIVETFSPQYTTWGCA